ncbi:MAG: 5-formyltetrahydrofolate cyclo-ligase [Gammaproteobacteria bacterium]
MNERSRLRAQMHTQRRALSRRDRDAAALAVAKRLTTLRAFRAAHHIACYWPYQGEVDLHPLMQRIWELCKHCYLPLVSSRYPQSLRFARHEPDTVLSLNHLGIAEPHAEGNKRVTAAALDLIIVPLVAFDAAGHRLGWGAGHYDRTLAFLNRRRHWRRPRLIGVGYDFQRVDNIESAPWDVPLDGVVTELRVYSKKGF